MRAANEIAFAAWRAVKKSAALHPKGGGTIFVLKARAGLQSTRYPLPRKRVGEFAGSTDLRPKRRNFFHQAIPEAEIANARYGKTASPRKKKNISPAGNPGGGFRHDSASSPSLSFMPAMSGRVNESGGRCGTGSPPAGVNLRPTEPIP